MARILLIDDDPQDRRLISRVLQGDGHEVLEAPHGQAGVRIFLEHPADLVITDLLMPEKDGLETIAELRRSAKGIKILAITGAVPGGPLDFREHARALGAQAALAKPFTPDQLREAMRKLLPT